MNLQEKSREREKLVLSYHSVKAHREPDNQFSNPMPLASFFISGVFIVHLFFWMRGQVYWQSVNMVYFTSSFELQVFPAEIWSIPCQNSHLAYISFQGSPILYEILLKTLIFRRKNLSIYMYVECLQCLLAGCYHNDH